MKVFQVAASLALLLMACLSVCTDAQARIDFPPYDLDSLIYQSSDVVEAVVSGIHSNGSAGKHITYSSTEVQILHVYTGKLRVGDIVRVEDFDQYVLREGMGWRETVGAGAHVTLFLTRSNRMGNEIDPDDHHVYCAPVLGGVKTEVEGRIRGFRSEMYEFCLEPPDPALPPAPTPAEFQTTLEDSVARVERWRPLLKIPKSAGECDAILDILRQRGQLPGAVGLHISDEIGICAAELVLSFHDPEREAMGIAMVAHGSFSCGILCRVQRGTPECAQTIEALRRLSEDSRQPQEYRDNAESALEQMLGDRTHTD